MPKLRPYNYAISACLVGVRCRYNGHGKVNSHARKIFSLGHSILICPEVAAGLPTPRPACEIIGGDGFSVLSKKAKVISRNRKDYSKFFIRGARQTLDALKLLGIKRAILKSGSPSCGVTKIYSGKFNGRKVKGAGVTAAWLKQNGVLIKEL